MTYLLRIIYKCMQSSVFICPYLNGLFLYKILGYVQYITNHTKLYIQCDHIDYTYLYVTIMTISRVCILL